MTKVEDDEREKEVKSSPIWEDFGTLSRSRKTIVITATTFALIVFTPAGIFVFHSLVKKFQKGDDNTNNEGKVE